ncbi:hypothetical protein QBC36DRAFT_314655 [Triangularia setosa]|uniref:Uncharacterized protein n=1 Tax=Triangularia setosa TaxID=2587417 RepID=A0AAN6W1P4_9PEZI|nr:hypothetical protein QBC36DRAFT_314655 [Podospora setosa]
MEVNRDVRRGGSLDPGLRLVLGVPHFTLKLQAPKIELIKDGHISGSQLRGQLHQLDARYRLSRLEAGRSALSSIPHLSKAASRKAQRIEALTLDSSASPPQATDQAAKITIWLPHNLIGQPYDGAAIFGILRRWTGLAHNPLLTNSIPGFFLGNCYVFSSMATLSTCFLVVKLIELCAAVGWEKTRKYYVCLQQHCPTVGGRYQPETCWLLLGNSYNLEDTSAKQCASPLLASGIMMSIPLPSKTEPIFCFLSTLFAVSPSLG